MVGFIIGLVVSMIIAVAIHVSIPRSEEIELKHAIIVAALAYILIPAVSAIPYLIRPGLSPLDAFFESIPTEKCHLLTVHTRKVYSEMNAQEGDYLFFGKETAGLPKTWLTRCPERCFTIPMWEPGVRSLNLASATSIVVYDALRCLNKFEDFPTYSH